MRAKFPVTVHLLFFREDQILLQRRFNTGFEDGRYSLPAGHLDGGETVRMAAVREALEEVGVHIDLEEAVFATVMHRKSDNTLSGADERVDFFVHIKKWDGEPFNAEPEKCDDLRWCDIEMLPVNTIPYVRKAIRNFLDGIPFDEFGWGG
jgi:8-oxo-dGTP pyrophosphatase MutT (NUDIX family)